MQRERDFSRLDVAQADPAENLVKRGNRQDKRTIRRLFIAACNMLFNRALKRLAERWRAAEKRTFLFWEIIMCDLKKLYFNHDHFFFSNV